MLTRTLAASSRPVKALAVNCPPWSVLNTPGLPAANASSSISRQNEPSGVFDSRHATTSRLYQSILGGHLVDGLVPLEGRQGDLGLEYRRVLLPLRYRTTSRSHQGSLTGGPKSGVRSTA
jgi:hypothetical protein